MGLVKHLKCRECGKIYLPIKIYTCEDCFGPLDVVYDYNSIELDKKTLVNRPKSLWRYFELLPVNDKTKIVDLGAGYTTLHKSRRLAEKLGLKDLYFKDDTVNPTNSFKDRAASTAVSKALEFGAKAIGCASTGNLAGAVAAHAAKAGMPCYIFVPVGVELNKIVQASLYGARIIAVKGTYDDTNRLAAQTAEAFDWAFANINIRPYYVEGSKSIAFEICEQLSWDTPDHIIVPSASGALLCAISKGLEEFRRIGLTDGDNVKISSAQAYGCAPIVKAFKSGNTEIFPIEKPETVAKSLAIGNPGDGIYALAKVRESGGVAEWAEDNETLQSIRLLAETEGIFTEPAGGVAVAVLGKLVNQGFIRPNDKVVCCVTGNGLKTTEAVLNLVSKPVEVEPSLKAPYAVA